MKFVIFFYLIFSASLFSYDFSEDVPENTILFVTVKDFTKLAKVMKKTSVGKFFLSDDFKVNRKRLSDFIFFKYYGGDEKKKQEETKLFKGFLSNPFVYTLGYDGFFNLSSGVIIKGNDLPEKFENIYKKIYGKNFKKGEIEIKKEILSGVKVNILTYIGAKSSKNLYGKKELSKKNILFVYGEYDDKLIITDSKGYFKTLIMTLKNKRVPKLKNYASFKKNIGKYENSVFYVYFNIEPLLRLLKAKKGYKRVINKFELNNLDTVIAYNSIKGNKQVLYLELSPKTKLPTIIKKGFFKNRRMKIPEFIPDTCYGALVYGIDFKNVFKIFKDIFPKKVEELNSLLLTMGLSYDDLPNLIGNDFYTFNFFNKSYSTVSSATLFKFGKPELILGFISKIGKNPAVGAIENDYLDGKLITFSSKEFMNTAIGYKNDYFILGDLNVVREIMQRMGGKGGSFHNSSFYKFIEKKLIKEQSLLYVSDRAVFSYLTIKKTRNRIDGLYSKGKSEIEMKALRVLKKIIVSLSQMTLRDWRKYFKYDVIQIYTEKEMLIIEIK